MSNGKLQVDYSPVESNDYAIDQSQRLSRFKARYGLDDVLSQYIGDDDSNDQADSGDQSMPPPPPPPSPTRAKRQRTTDEDEREPKKSTSITSTHVAAALQKFIDRETARTGKACAISGLSAVPFKTVFNMMAGEAAALLETGDDGQRVPIIVRLNYQSNEGEPKSINDIIKSRQPYHYLETYDEEANIFILRKFTKVWYEAQSVLVRYRSSYGWLVSYAPRDGSFHATRVQYDERTIKRTVKELIELVDGKKA